MLRLALVLAVLLTAALPGPGATETVSFTVDEARLLARDAYLGGDVPLAYAVAKGLLQRDPRDRSALLVVAAAAPRLGFGKEGRIAGRTAFRLVETPVLRYEAARFTARAAFVEQRFGLAQNWLRRATDLAPTPAKRAQTIRDFRDVRARNPWRFGVDLSLSPSDNLNDGSESSYLIIDGVPYVGEISGSAQALSGVRLSLGATAGYRFPGGVRSQTELSGRVYGTFNWLSDEAKAQVMTPIGPALVGSDLNYALAEVSLTHRRVWGALRRPMEVTAAAGQSWYGGEPFARHWRLEASQPVDLSKQDSAEFSLSTERQMQIAGASSQAWALGARMFRDTASGDRITAGLTLSTVASESTNSEYDAISAHLGYAFARPVAGVSLSAQLSASWRDYPDYRIGFITVPGGRQDDKLGLSLDMQIKNVDVWGYSPVITVQASRTLSNVSRFETTDLGVSFGFRSSF